MIDLIDDQVLVKISNKNNTDNAVNNKSLAS